MDSITVRAKELAKMLNVSLVTIRRADAAGKLPAPCRIGGCVLWDVAEVKRWIEAGSPDRATWEARKKVQAGRTR